MSTTPTSEDENLVDRHIKQATDQITDAKHAELFKDEDELRKLIVNTTLETKLLHNSYDVSIIEDDKALHAAIEKEIDACMAALSAYIQRKIEQNDRKTLETVAAMTGGGSSPQEALDTIQFYAHNKLLVINGRLTPPPSKDEP